jgi:chlorophyllide a reductase subunit Z
MLVSDHDRAGGYWGAVYVFTAIKGLQVIIDGPVGCENLPVTSVLHYTDALPPHELPIVVTGLSEAELGQHGTEGAMKRAHKTLDPDLPSVVVTGSIAEMIGGGVTPEGHRHPALPAPHHRRGPVAERGPAPVLAVVAVRAEAGPRAQAQDGEKPRVNIIGPAYGTFNMPSDLAEIRRLVGGDRGRGELVFPLGAHLADVRSSSTLTPTSACTASSAPALRGAGAALPAGADRPALDDRVPALLGRDLGLDPEPSSPARSTPHQAALGPVALGDAGLLRHRILRGRRERDLRPGLRHFLEDEMGLPCTFAVARKAGAKTDNDAVRQLIREKTPLVLFGSYNERMYLAECGKRAVYIPASFPGAVIRRHTGTPFMGYAGATYLVQEVCNALFDALFHILPLSVDMDRADPTPARFHRELAWDADASAALDEAVEAEPVLVRISAAKRPSGRAERREACRESRSRAARLK